MKRKEIFYGGELDRVIYIWARCAGLRDMSKEGKHYTKSDLQELIRRLNKYKDDKDSFRDGFEIEEKEE